MSKTGDDELPLPAHPADASVTLNHALDDLEDMLDLRGDDDPHASDVGNQESGIDGSSDDAQYSIPLLSDVVSPATATTADTLATAAAADEDYSESARLMAERLSSEIDIIVQGAVDEAVELLRRDLGERLREHLDITMPEVLEELVQLRRR